MSPPSACPTFFALQQLLPGRSEKAPRELREHVADCPRCQAALLSLQAGGATAEFPAPGGPQPDRAPPAPAPDPSGERTQAGSSPAVPRRDDNEEDRTAARGGAEMSLC